MSISLFIYHASHAGAMTSYGTESHEILKIEPILKVFDRLIM